MHKCTLINSKFQDAKFMSIKYLFGFWTDGTVSSQQTLALKFILIQNDFQASSFNARLQKMIGLKLNGIAFLCTMHRFNTKRAREKTKQRSNVSVFHVLPNPKLTSKLSHQIISISIIYYWPRMKVNEISPSSR